MFGVRLVCHKTTTSRARRLNFRRITHHSSRAVQTCEPHFSAHSIHRFIAMFVSSRTYSRYVPSLSIHLERRRPCNGAVLHLRAVRRRWWAFGQAPTGVMRPSDLPDVQKSYGTQERQRDLPTGTVVVKMGWGENRKGCGKTSLGPIWKSPFLFWGAA